MSGEREMWHRERNGEVDREQVLDGYVCVHEISREVKTAT